MHDNTEMPPAFEDIIALLKFEDIGPVAQVGYLAKHEKHGVIFVLKCAHYVCLWSQVIKWDYMKDVLPGYTLFKK